MEPFGLFQFLQSLLNSTPETAKNADSEVKNEVGSQTNIPPAPAPQAPSKSNVDNTYLHFITDHEKRVHKTKK